MVIESLAVVSPGIGVTARSRLDQPRVAGVSRELRSWRMPHADP